MSVPHPRSDAVQTPTLQNADSMALRIFHLSCFLDKLSYVDGSPPASHVLFLHGLLDSQLLFLANFPRPPRPRLGFQTTYSLLFKTLLPKINLTMRATKFASRITQRQLASCLNHEQTLTNNRLFYTLQTTIHIRQHTHKNHHKYYAEEEYKLCLKTNVTYYSSGRFTNNGKAPIKQT